MKHSRGWQADWAALRPEQQAAILRRNDWLDAARPEQKTPEGDWDTWLILAGRGWGKTRTGAEDAAWAGLANPGWRIAVVAPTIADARDTCIEGDSGLMGILPPECVQAWNRSLGELILTNGSRYKAFSADEPNRLRGPQHHRAWCFVAGTMVSTPDGETAIEALKPGDFVLTRKGPRAVLAKTSRRAVVGRVLFSNGRELVGTADHPVYSSHGWTNLSDLCRGSRVCAIGAFNGAGGLGTSTEADAEVTTNAQTKLAGKSARCVCTVKRGLPNAAQSLTGSMFTTSMATVKTTLSAISNWSHTLGIVRFIGQLKARALIGQAFLSRQRPALTAVASVAGNGWAAMPSARNANTSALRHGGASPPFAGAAVRSSCLGVETIAASVVSTWQRMADSEVYCLKVAGEPEYFANGILVHNCDELAAWNYPDAWDQLLFGLRLGDRPQAVVTTTPRPTPMVRSLAKAPRTVITKGSTFDNAANLAPSALQQLREKYEGTRLGRQELYAEILDDVPGALWTRAMIKTGTAPEMARIVVAVDPSGASGSEDGDSIGIVAAGRSMDGRFWVLEDATCDLGPAGWGRRAVERYHAHGADRIVAERNFGGAMVESVIRTADRNVPVKLVTASRGKAVRAEPIAALYEQGRVTHARGLDALEDQMVQMTLTGFVGDGSPDRVDALVWALSELAISPQVSARTGTVGGLF